MIEMLLEGIFMRCGSLYTSVDEPGGEEYILGRCFRIISRIETFCTFLRRVVHFMIGSHPRTLSRSISLSRNLRALTPGFLAL